MTAAFTDLVRRAVERMVSRIHESRTLTNTRDEVVPSLLALAAVSGQRSGSVEPQNMGVPR